MCVARDHLMRPIRLVFKPSTQNNVDAGGIHYFVAVAILKALYTVVKCFFKVIDTPTPRFYLQYKLIVRFSELYGSENWRQRKVHRCMSD